MTFALNVFVYFINNPHCSYFRICSTFHEMITYEFVCILKDDFDELDTIYTEEKRQLAELEEKFKTLEEQYTTIMEEKRIAREKREAAERELRAMIKAASVIQSFWKAYKMRKALKSKKKKGKKGKRGRGKKKR